MLGVNFLLLLTALATAQETSIIYPTTAAPSATIVPGIHDYEYAGCWNETTGFPDSGGLRALNNGNIVRNRSHHTPPRAMYILTGL